MLLALALWSLGNMLEIGCTRLPAKLLWANVQYLGIVSVNVLWFILGVQYSSGEHRPTRRQLALLAITPMVTLLLVWTDPWHGLMRRNVRLGTKGPFAIIARILGPLVLGTHRLRLPRPPGWLLCPHSQSASLATHVPRAGHLPARGRFPAPGG